MAMRSPKPDGSEFPATRVVRSSSISSDLHSTSTKSIATSASVPFANPPPAYISQKEASSLISIELERPVTVSRPALTLVNEFLDHVLFSLLSTSHSVSIGPLKVAVPTVLKPRLGKAALRVAEEELKEYMEDEEEQELNSKRGTIEPGVDFDTELMWKLARLRCMVYTRLGDLEEEDEEEWLEKEQLLEQVQTAQKHSKTPAEMGPGAAIFLTSVIEYLGEQALYYAAQYAQKRHDLALSQDTAKLDTEGVMPSRQIDEIVMEGKDMNHVGRDSPLSRLWRSWRRNTRSNGDSFSRPMSPEAAGGVDSPSHSRTNSSIPAFGAIVEENHAQLKETSAEPTSPSQIPLPMSEDDVAEIQGFSTTTDDHIPLPERSHKRPTSLVILPVVHADFDTPNVSDAPEYAERSPLRPTVQRIRSQSLPLTPTPFDIPQKQAISPIVRDTENVIAQSKAHTAHDSEVLDNTVHPVVMEGDVPSPPQSQSLLDGTIAAIAGALGGVAGASYLTKSDAEIDKATHAPVGDVSDHQYLNDGPAAHPASDAYDFGSTQLPEDSQTPSRDHHHESSDPEDLALSSADEAQPKPIATNRKPRISKEIQQESWFDAEEAPTEQKDGRLITNEAAAPTSLASSNYNAVTLPVVPEKSVPLELQADPLVTSTNNTNGPPISNSGVWPVIVPGRSSSIEDPALGHSPSPSKSSHSAHHSKSSSSSSKLLGFTRDMQGFPKTIHQQKAAGDMSDNVRAAHSATPVGISKEDRPGTADSTSTTKAQHLRIRSDSEELLKQHALLKNADEDKKRSLEVLINSGETLHYTLTPATATVRPEVLSAASQRSQTQDLADFIRSTGPSVQDKATPRPVRPVKNDLGAASASSPVTRAPDTTTAATHHVVTETDSSARARSRLGEPRDAKVERITGTRDLADYARSTGPQNPMQLPKPLVVGRSPGTDPSMSPTQDSLPGRGVRQSATPTAQADTSRSSVKKNPNRLKLQPRDARPSRHAESTELIDFIREGPPRQAGDHRINRNIAPFRTTMDSDDFNNMASAADKSLLSQGSESSTYENHRAQAYGTSTNSQSGSFAHSSASGGGFTSQERLHPSAIAVDNDSTPRRTQRRAKDPYAIDYSDDEYDRRSRSSKQQTQDESLIDFLRNTAPAPGMITQPVLAAGAVPQDHSVKRMSSNNRIKDLVRGSARSTSALDGRTDEATSLSTARPESPHLTQVGTKLDSYKPTKGTHAAHMDRQRRRSRPDSRDNGETSDLISFLKNTEPPAYSPQPRTVSASATPNIQGQQKGEAGLKKFFSRRGKGRG